MQSLLFEANFHAGHELSSEHRLVRAGCESLRVHCVFSGVRSTLPARAL